MNRFANYRVDAFHKKLARTNQFAHHHDVTEQVLPQMLMYRCFLARLLTEYFDSHTQFATPKFSHRNLELLAFDILFVPKS
jgi:hypothetical protein